MQNTNIDSNHLILPFTLGQANIRQLENLIERLVVTSDSVIQQADLPELISDNVTSQIQWIPPTSLDEAIDNVKKTLVTKSYKNHKSSRKVAKDLNISQTRAVTLINQYCKPEFK